MSILNVQTLQAPGLVGVLPSVIYIYTNDTYATVTATGYLTAEKSQGFTFSNNQMALVYTSDEGPVWLKVVITFSGSSILNTVVSLSQISSPGDVVLPTIANNIIVSTDTAGTLGNTTATAINRGSIQAGLSGDAGTLISYSATAARGSLIVAAVANTGNTNVTISNAAHGQASVISIPDGGQATSNFLITNSAGTQTIATGSLALTLGSLTVAAGNIAATLGSVAAGTTVTAGTGITATTGNITASAGNLIAGASGAAGTVTSFPGTAANGSLILAAVNAGGAFNTTISNGTTAQSQIISIPDSGAATANFLLSALTGAGIQHITSGSLEVDAGSLISGIGTGGFVGLVKAFPTTATSGFIALQAAVNATGNFGLTISNATAQAQATTLTIPDVGGATGFLNPQSVTANLTPAGVIITKDITLGFAALAAAGQVTIQAALPTAQFKIRDIFVNYGAAGLSGGGGDRLITITDGTTVYNNAGITAALLGTPVNTVWGGTGNPLAGTVAQNTSSVAGAKIYAVYSGGAADYTAGSVDITVTYERVA